MCKERNIDKKKIKGPGRWKPARAAQAKVRANKKNKEANEDKFKKGDLSKTEESARKTWNQP